jgi:Flp pilus assembly pilin Flp
MWSGSWLARLTRDESGAAGIEYGLLVAAIAAGIVVTAFLVGDQVANAFNYASTTIDDEL